MSKRKKQSDPASAKRNRERLERERAREARARRKRGLPIEGNEGVYLDGKRNVSKEISYSEYLLTLHWRRARAHAIKLAGGLCLICQSGFKLNVHHLHYCSLWNERANDVVVLCEWCHHELHAENVS
jgi:hypothetical protein